MEAEKIPANGTRAAVTYWARRTRSTIRTVETLLDIGHLDAAETNATDASGEADEFEQAVEAYATQQRRIPSARRITPGS